jgi:small subunit ribosomal protein S13
MAKEEFPEDFRYLVRIENTDLDGKRNVVSALTGIKGINHRLSRVVAETAGVNLAVRIGELTDEEIDTVVKTIENVDEIVPTWMVNRRMDPETGDDIHLVGSEIPMQLTEDINNLKKIRSWKGMRHEKGLPVRGQRTKSNGRTGATVGVQRKK